MPDPKAPVRVRGWRKEVDLEAKAFAIMLFAGHPERFIVPVFDLKLVLIVHWRIVRDARHKPQLARIVGAARELSFAIV